MLLQAGKVRTFGEGVDIQKIDYKRSAGGLNWSMQQIHVFTENLVCLEDQDGSGRPPS